MELIQVNDLRKNYGEFPAVKGVSFSVNEGEIFGFLGPNGAGKTTVINMLTGLARITSGRAEISGYDCAKEIKQIQALIGIVPDESNLYDEYTGYENLCFCAALYGMEKAEREARARLLLKQFGLAEAGKKLFKSYSKGMKRKLTIAAGIIHEPKILFLDEPTTGIDVASARQIRKMLKELNRKGTTIFLTTHYIEEAERLCDRVAFIVDGRIVRSGTIDEYLTDVQHEYIVQFSVQNAPDGIAGKVEAKFPGIQAEASNSNQVRVVAAFQPDLIPFMQYFSELGVTVYEAKIIKPSLEEVFVRVTGIGLEKMKAERERGKK